MASRLFSSEEVLALLESEDDCELDDPQEEGSDEWPGRWYIIQS